jgi:hypothetical protein
MRFTEDLSGRRVLLPASAPEHGCLILVALVAIVSEEDVLVTLALYDDPGTRRAVDYLELYDVSGALLVISWIDRVGVLRTAIDRGLLDEEDEVTVLEGVLVPEGTPL